MLKMLGLIAFMRACVSLVFCILILVYVIKLLKRLERTTVVAGRLFLAAKKLHMVNVAMLIGLVLVHVFTVTLLVENYVVREIGRYFVSLSLPFFLYAVHELYEVVR